MSRLKITEKIIAKLKAPDPSGKQKLYFDSELKGFGVLCSGVSNSKTFIAQRDLPDGRTRRVTLGAVAEIDLETARSLAADTLHALRKGRDPKAKSLTLSSALENYLTARKDLRPNSIKVYRDGVQNHLRPWLDLPLNAITSQMITDRHGRIADEVAKGKRYSGKTVANMTMRALRAVWRFAAYHDADLGPHPVKLAGVWNPEHRRERRVEPEQLPAFYAAVQALANPVARDFLRFLLFTGLRVGEASRLTWTDIDLVGRVIHVPASSTKAKRNFDLPLSDFTHDMLVARRSIGDAKFVFPGPGKDRHVVDASHPLGIIEKATGIRISAHDLRRTHATTANEAEVPFMAMKMLLNHSVKTRDVTEGYIGISTEKLRAHAQKVADKLKELCRIPEPVGAIKIRGQAKD